jgi:Dolichyl-phosphate-mannose-protein mannosyltransferase
MKTRSLSAPAVEGDLQGASLFGSWLSNVRGLSVVAAVLAYCIGVMFCIFTRRPTGNEAWFFNPAMDIVVRHKMGTPILGSNLTWLAGIDQNTYWTMPLYSLAQVPWYLIFGFGLVSQRLLSLVCGLGVLWCVYKLVLKLTNPWAASLSVILVSCDWMFIRQSADGRMDMLCALLGFSGLVVYVSRRETRFTQAMVLANSAVVASCMTHPCGVLAASSLWLLILYLDRKRLRWRDIGLAAIPYAVAGLSWGAYISRAPASFLLQMKGNAKGVQSDIGGRDRLTELNPFKAFSAEFYLRYVDSYHSRLIPIIYMVGLASIVFLAWKTRRKEHVVIAAIGVVYFVELMWLEGLKSENYLAHSVPVLGMVLAVALCSISFRSKLTARIVIVLVVALFLSRQAVTAYWFGNDSPGSRDYFSTLQFVGANHAPHEELLGPADLGYGLGFYSGLTEDWHIGYVSGETPRIMVLGRLGRAWLNKHKNDSPEFSRFVDHRLNVEYSPVLVNSNYTVYQRRGVARPLAAPPDLRHASLVNLYLRLRPPQ